METPEQVPTSTFAIPAPSNTPHRSHVAVIVVAAFALLFAWQWYDSRRQIDTLEQELGRRLAQADAQNQQSLSTAEQVQDAVREMQTRLAQVEDKLQTSQNQQLALEALYKELARSRDESVLADIEQLLLVANQQLQIAGSVHGALITLEAADAQLARGDRPQFAGLRKVFARDIDRLKRAPSVDTAGISARLDALIGSIDELPLAMEARPPADDHASTAPVPASGNTGAGNADPLRSSPTSAPPNAGIWQKLLNELWSDLRSLVRIERTDHSDIALLTPEQTYFLRQNLQLRLLSARFALLARDDKSFHADIIAARGWLQHYYDTSDPRVANALATLQQLNANEVGAELPDLGASLDAVREYRRTHEEQH